MDNLSMLDKIIDFLFQKGFTAVSGGLGFKLVFFDSALAGDDKVEVLAIGAFLLAVSTIVSYLTWKERVQIKFKKSQKANKDLDDTMDENP